MKGNASKYVINFPGYAGLGQLNDEASTNNNKLILPFVVPLAKLAKTFVRKIIRKFIQVAILQNDVILETTRLAIIKETNSHVNRMQQWLFSLSMWMDRRFQS